MRTFAADLYLLVAAFGLALPVSYAGLPMLGQGAFIAVGAFGTFLLAAHGVPLLVAVAATVAIAAVAGYLVGYAATRLAGASLALATWGLAWLTYVVLVQFPAVSGGSQGLTHESPARLVSPSLGLTVTAHPWVHVTTALVLDLLLAAMLWRAGSGPWSLDWAALRTGPVLADSLGVPVQRRRRALLSASAAIGALGGAGGALLAGVVAPADYSPLLSLQLFVAVLIGGVASWWGPIVGVALLAALPSSSDRIASAAGIDPLRSRAALTAALLVAALVLRRPAARLLRRWATRIPVGRRQRDRGHGPDRVPTRPVEPMHATGGGLLLQLMGVGVDYGAVRALDDVSLELLAGEVHALVGPNGSGKSTVLRVATGLTQPSSGAVAIDGRASPPAGAAAPRVIAGVVRTLQRTALSGALPASTQVAIGARARDRTPYLGLRHLLATPVARDSALRRARVSADALIAVGLDDVADKPADRLNTADQRLLQVARAVATGAPAVLVDEPAAGMSRPDRDRLEQTLRNLAGTGRGVLLVEHDMGLVSRAADRVTVLDAGRVIATGRYDEIRTDAAVRRAYLGDVDATTEEPAHL